MRFKAFAVLFIVGLMLTLTIKPVFHIEQNQAAAVTPTPTPTPTAQPPCKAQLGSYFCAPNSAATPGQLLYAPNGMDITNNPQITAWVNPNFTLTGATPTLLCDTAIGIYSTDYEVLTTNVTAVTTPANGVCPKGKIIHVQFVQSASGGPYTIVAVASWTAGSGTTFGSNPATCTIGTTQGAIGTSSVINYDLINGGPAGSDDWEVLACPTVR